MNKIDYNNLFLTKLTFGLNVKNYIVIAKDSEDAENTINEYFSDYVDVIYLLSVQKLNDLIVKVKEQDKLFHLVIEVGSKINTDENIALEEVIINEHEEFGLTFDDLHIKYKDKQIIVLSFDDIVSLLEQTHKELEDPNNEILISSNFDEYFN